MTTPSPSLCWVLIAVFGTLDLVLYSWIAWMVVKEGKR